jgi:hypothetical protein
MQARQRVEFTGVELAGDAELAAPVEKADHALEKAVRRSGRVREMEGGKTRDVARCRMGELAARREMGARVGDGVSR